MSRYSYPYGFSDDYDRYTNSYHTQPHGSSVQYTNPSEGVSSRLNYDGVGGYNNVSYTNQTTKVYSASKGTVTVTQSNPMLSTISTKPYSEKTEHRNDIVKIVCISDTHNGHQKPHFHDKIARMEGDILIHAGDFSDQGSNEEVMSILSWLHSLHNFKYKVLIAGNMDGISLDASHTRDGNSRIGDGKQRRQEQFKKYDDVIYLENEQRRILDINIYGCPYTPRYFGGFQYDRGSTVAKRLWERVPGDCDILVSHGPPYGILDITSQGEHVGCKDLLDAVRRQSLLKAVVFGHVHNGYGAMFEFGKLFINAAQSNGIHIGDSRNQPFQFLIHKSTKKILDSSTISASIGAGESGSYRDLYDDRLDTQMAYQNEGFRRSGDRLRESEIHPQSDPMYRHGHAMPKTTYNPDYPWQYL